MVSMILHDQIAIVTGGGQGIGKAISIRLASEGADIGILDINEKTATRTGEEVQKGRRATVWKSIAVES